MANFEKKIITIVGLVFAFQLLFPQYSYAHGLDGSSEARESMLAINNLLRPIIFDRVDNGQYLRLPKTDFRQPIRKVKVTITAYSSTIDQTDSDPFTTANGRKVNDGIIAANFLPFGTKVKMPKIFGDKVFSVEDRMNARYDDGHLDIWLPTREQAKKFGVKYVEVEIY
ncbi:3D domain-containing protein [Candidatus Falkowbacteria bacterium]|nr:3D domain-containing protein [Candidatus Falkowbacteria bacterium]